MATSDDDLPAQARSDPFRPPADPCECFCLHCQRVVNSADMWYQPVVNGPPGSTGFWMCPTPNCGGAGFTFDIFPTDPAHPANEGWVDDDDEDGGGVPFDDGPESADDPAEYDPAEPQWSDVAMGGLDDDDDIEGEEWKHGLQPGERLPESPEVTAAWAAREAEREAEQRKYDEPDRRPRSIDGSKWPRRQDDGREITDDDIPY